MPEPPLTRRNLEQLRKQARELLREMLRGAPEALSRWDAQFPKRPSTVRLAHAQTVIARENGYPSWPKLKIGFVERQPLRFRRRKGPKKMPGRQFLEELYSYTLLLVARGDTLELAFRPSPSGQYGKTIAWALRALLVERGTLEGVVELALRGIQHPNAKVRYDCAHALDWLGDDRCVSALLELLRDPVPRVRWIALHSLRCDECKLQPLQPRPELKRIALELASHDPNRRVRHAAREIAGLAQP